MTYLVTWKYKVENADSPEAAALESVWAMSYQTSKNGYHMQVEVEGKDGIASTIELVRDKDVFIPRMVTE